MRRLEDDRLLRGGGRYVSDIIALSNALHVAVLRSPHAHAQMSLVDTSAARMMAGVVAVLTGADMEGIGDVPCDWAPLTMTAEVTHPILARDTVHYAGQPVAAVAASTAEQALDAAEAIVVTYAALAATTDQERALEPSAPRIHAKAEGNLGFRMPRSHGDIEKAFKDAERVISRRLVNNRLIPSPMETRAALSDFDPKAQTLLHHTTSQLPHLHARSLARCIGMPLHKLRLIVPDVGGGFGAKLTFYPEDVICALLSQRTGRPCGWIEGRTESFTATTHGRDHVHHAEIAATRDGVILGLKVRIVADLGAYAVGMGPGIIAINTGASITGPYRIENVSETIEAVYTNRTPTGPYRGAGHPEATYLIERMIDALASDLGIDPAELRRRNLVPASGLPYRLPLGLVLDSGDYTANLTKAMEISDYHGLRERQRTARAEGRCMGVGVITFSESSGVGQSIAMGPIGMRRAGHESARVVVHPDGKVSAFSGAQSQGQGHATSLAQIAAGALGLDPEDISIIQGDTQAVPFGTGTFNSRTMSVGGSAIHLAAIKVLAKIKAVAAHKLQCRVDDLVYADGRFSVSGHAGPVASIARVAKQAEDKVTEIVFKHKSGIRSFRRERDAVSYTFADIANEAHLGHDVPLGLPPGLDEMVFYDPKEMSFAYGSHVASVEVDLETGHVGLLGYWSVDDCGRIINPLLARGQVHGGLAQGIGQALMEGVAFGSDGVMTQSGFEGYAMPRAMDLPHFQTSHTEVPAKGNPLGARGIGEGATIAAPPVIVNAVLDAVAHLGVTHIDMPLTPMTVWRAIEAARLAGEGLLDA